jgi:hypothetical protein
MRSEGQLSAKLSLEATLRGEAAIRPGDLRSPRPRFRSRLDHDIAMPRAQFDLAKVSARAFFASSECEFPRKKKGRCAGNKDPFPGDVRSGTSPDPPATYLMDDCEAME